MDQPNGPWQTEEEPGSRRSPGLIAAAATAVVVLALVGGTTGYLLAGGSTGPASTGGPSDGPLSPSATTGSPQAASESPSPASVTPSARPTSTAPADGFRLPDVTGRDFEDVFRELRGRKLGVQVFFRSTGDSRRVERTEPRAGEIVWPGITVKLFVAGRPPEASVPGVVGLLCNEAGRIVAEHGLTPRYETGRTGTVWRQDPEPPGALRWNDQVRLFCAAESPSPSAP
jgi:hypothetical protein